MSGKNSVSSDKIQLRNVRLSFLKIEKPEAYEAGQKEKYQCTALLDPSDADHKKYIALLKQTAAQVCGEAYGEIPDEIKMEPLKGLPFGDADKHPKKRKYDGYENMFYVVTANTLKPAIANRQGQSVLPGEPQFPYSGCYGNVNLSLWALLGPQRQKHGPMIRANLIGVQFVRDGDAFGQAPPSAEEEFEALEDDSFADTGAAKQTDATDDDPFDF